MADLAQCGRCRAFTLLDKTGPVAVAVDFMAAGRDAYIAALVGETGLYRARKRQDGATRLLAYVLGAPVPFEASTGAQTGTEPVHVEHGCPASVQRVVKTAAPKDSALVTHGDSSGGRRPLAAHVYAARGPATRSPVTPATRPRGDIYPVCGTCRRNIPNGRLFTGIQHGPIWIWAECERCE